MTLSKSEATAAGTAHPMPPKWAAWHVLWRPLWLEARHRVQRVPLVARIGVPLLACACLLLIPLAYGRTVLALAAAHLLSVAVCMALQSALVVSLSRSHWTRYFREGWLATLPVRRSAQKASICAAVCAGPLALVMLWVAAAAVAQTRAHVDHFAALLPALAIGALVGLPLGWWMQRPQTARRASRRIRIASAPPALPDLANLSRWPLVQARQWLEPRLLARLSLVALLLPLDMPANIAVALLFLFILATYLVVLLGAAIRVVRDSASWLRPTPLPHGRLAWHVSWLVAVKQLQWTAIGAVILMCLGMNPVRAVRLAELWLACAGTLLSIAVAHSRATTGLTLRMCLAAGVLTAAECLRQHVSLPLALLLSGWQLRKVGES